MVAVHECSFELLTNTLFDRSGYIGFPTVCGRASEDSEAVIMTVNEWIEEQDENFFCGDVKILQQR